MTSSTAGHTAGPWEFREIAPYDDGLGYISADGHDIIHAGVGDLPADENRANARLVAAAPDMLAALKQAEELYQFGIMNAPDGLFDEVQRLRRAAISKATGAA